MTNTRQITFASLLMMVATTAGAQPITVERDKVLGQFGTVVDQNISVRPTRNGPGAVVTQLVQQPDVNAIRLRFRVDDRGDAGFWTVVVTAGNRRWEYAPADDETEFWSDEMPGGSATVSIVSTVVNPRVRLTVDRTAGSIQPTVPKSITLPDEREPWDQVADPFRTVGRSVVRLRFVDDVRKKVFVCTGWVVFNSRHILTNEHCINSDPEMRSALADVDFDQGVTPARSLRFRRLLLTDARLDFSLLELEQPLDRPALSLGGAVKGNQALAIVQHPAGEPKQLSQRGCDVSATGVPGISTDPTDFEHRCDTLGGSSGSPVFATDTMRVVGLHHLGFLPGDKPVNRAVLMTDVIAKIKEKLPNLVRSGSN